MSTIAEYPITCVMCGETSDQTMITSCSNFGYPDLDWRPPSMFRETMSFWVEECPYCGYINGSIKDAGDFKKESLAPIYRTVEALYDWGDCSDYYGSRLAKLFAKQGATYAYAGQLKEAAHAFLRAAWSFEDVKDNDGALFWRKRALYMIEQEETRTPLYQNPQLLCIKADILRRVGDFEALSYLDYSPYAESPLAEVISFQIERAAVKDTGCHAMHEVPGWGKDEIHALLKIGES